MAAAIYVRVSTPGQEEGSSLASQESICKAAADKDGHTVPEQFIWREKASGEDLHRDALNDLRRAARQHQFDVLYVYHSDRLSRDPLDIMTLLKEFTENGVRVEFVSDSLGPTDRPDAAPLLFIRGWSAQQERLRFRERSMLGRRVAAEKEQRVPHGDGRGIYGYRYDPITKTRSIIEEEAVIVRRIFDEVADGRSMYAVCCRLMEDGVPTKLGGKIWHVTTVRQILDHERYYGLDVYGRNRIMTRNQSKEDPGPKKTTHPRPESEWILIEGYTPPIITKAQYDAAHLQLAMRQPVHNDERRVNFLTGITVCGTCGEPVRSATQRHYRCKATKKARFITPTCFESNIPKDAMEDLVWKTVCDMILQPDLLLQTVRDSLNAIDENLPNQIASAERALATTERKHNELLDSKSELPPGVYHRRLDRLNAQYARQEGELTKWKTLYQQQVDVSSQEGRILKRCELVRTRIASADAAEKGRILRLFGARIVATRRHIDVTLVVDAQSMTTLSPRTC